MQKGLKNLIHLKKDFNYTIISQVYPPKGSESDTKFFCARETVTNRVVGIKQIKCNPQKFNIYKREITVLMNLEGDVSDIPVIYCYDYKDGVLTIVMQYFEGQTLAECMETEKATDSGYVARTLKRLRALATILGEVHRKGIQHNDLKPQNIIIQSKAGREKVKLIDFGLSGGAVVRGTGTKGYQAPEQDERFSGACDTSRIDVFVFGIIMYELFAGRKPELITERGADGRVIGWKNFQEIDNPNVPKEANEIIRKCLAFNPRDRYANGGEIECQIKRIIPKRK